jgi:protein-S-isoprenylcysteine O-methyltransferase Ste14
MAKPLRSKFHKNNGFRWSKWVGGCVLAAVLYYSIVPDPHSLPELHPTGRPDDTNRDRFVNDQVHQTRVIPSGVFMIVLVFLVAWIPWHQWTWVQRPAIQRLRAAFYPASPMYRRWSPADIVAFVASGLGSALRIWSMQTLSKFFTYTVRILPEHELITQGPYHWLLHPGYLGLWVGIGGYNYYFGLRGVLWIAIQVGILIGIGLRVQNEEAVLAGHFGTSWTAYSTTRWHLLPGIW